MTTTQHSVLDFSSPRRPPTAALRQLSLWQRNVCAHVQDGWAGLLAKPVQLHVGKVEPMQQLVALNNLPDESLGAYFSIGESVLPSMLVISAKQVQGLLSDLLDLPGEQWPEPNALSAAEEAILELLFVRFAEAIGEAWPGAHPLKCKFLEMTHRPRRTRIFPLSSALFSIRIKLVSRFGEEVGTWLILKEETERLMLEHLGETEVEERGIHPDLLALTEKVPLQIKVELGRVQLRMSQASALAVGDVLILDQFVNRPLIASVEGQPKWAGVPMRIGSRQALEITDVLDSTHQTSPHSSSQSAVPESPSTADTIPGMTS